MSHFIRPKKKAQPPPPVYLTVVPGEPIPYCTTCGRIITPRKSKSGQTNTPVKYCSDRCRREKPGARDRTIEQAVAQLLDGADPDNIVTYRQGTKSSAGVTARSDRLARPARSKGEPRLTVTCDYVQDLLFGLEEATEDRKRGVVDDPYQWNRVLMEEDKLPVQPEAEKQTQCEETEAMRRTAGEQRAKEREMVRRAARRACVFGLLIEKDGRATEQIDPRVKHCEAVQNGKVVEPSFAKGNWGVRWRESELH